MSRCELVRRILEITRARATVLAAVGMLAAFGGCGRDPGTAVQDAPTDGRQDEVVTLRRGNGPEPDSLDPQRARTEAALNVLRDVFEGLTAVGADGAPVPAAASSWDVSPDRLTYTFHLRNGLRWSN